MHCLAAIRQHVGGIIMSANRTHAYHLCACSCRTTGTAHSTKRLSPSHSMLLSTLTVSQHVT